MPRRRGSESRWSSFWTRSRRYSPVPTRPNRGSWTSSSTALGVALGNRETRPRGKLVLGFRKEWLAEIDRRLAEAKRPLRKVFLKQLDRRRDHRGDPRPRRAGRLQRQYHLAIEDGLPEVIADNLLADAGSALAPTLQVLLSKMWERAGRSNPDQPRFDRASLRVVEAGRVPVERRARRGPEGDRPLERRR